MCGLCFGVTRRYLHSRADAEDAAQEAALRAWRFGDRLAPGTAPEAWIRRIARNEALRRLTAIGRVTELRDAVGEESGVDRALVVDVRDALARLSDADRRLVALRYGGDLTNAAIAEATGMPEGTVKVRLHRARSTLRRLLIHYDAA